MDDADGPRDRRAEERASLHARLDELLDEREALEEATATSGVVLLGGKARAIFAAAADFVADVAGELVTWTSLQSYFPDKTVEFNTLLMLRERLGLAKRFLGSPGGHREARGLGGRTVAVPCTPLDIDEIRKQVFAVARGDEARLFWVPPGNRGTPNNQARLADCQVRALQYDAYMMWQGLKAKDRQEEIVEAFGENNWNTIFRWRTQCERNLGRDHVEGLIAIAANGYIINHGDSLEGLGLEEAGKEYRQVKAETKAAWKDT